MAGKSNMEPILFLWQVAKMHIDNKERTSPRVCGLRKCLCYNTQAKTVWTVRWNGVGSGYIRIVQGMYQGQDTSGHGTNRFTASVGVYHGSYLNPYLFIMLVDDPLTGGAGLLVRAISRKHYPIRWLLYRQENPSRKVSCGSWWSVS